MSQVATSTISYILCFFFFLGGGANEVDIYYVFQFLIDFFKQLKMRTGSHPSG